MEAAFSAQLIRHNIQVSMLAAALGVTFGIGTALLLFENGVLLGAVAVRYTQQGFGLFMTAWLLPHGVFEIPSILIAGQAGFYLARLLLHRREDRNVRHSMREWLVLVAGLAMMLVWAGIMEAFLFPASRARSAVCIQGCGCRNRTRAADDLSIVDRTKRGRRGSPPQCSFGENDDRYSVNPRIDSGRTDHCHAGRCALSIASGRSRFPPLCHAARYRDRAGNGKRT